jgi:hypothetical protein
MTTGKLSKYRDIVPTKMMKTMDALAENPDFMRSVDEIQLMESRVMSLLDDLKEGVVDRSLANKHLDAVFAAIEKNDSAKMRSSLIELQKCLKASINEDETWELILETLGERRKTVDIERRVIESQKTTLAPEELVWLALQISNVMFTLKEHVPQKIWNEQAQYLEEVLLGRKSTRAVDVTAIELLGGRD